MSHDSTILIVDDEPAGRETLQALLTGQGYALAFAADGPETLAKAAELTPDLILLDVMMPGMDGLEVCRYLRADPRLAHVPVILVTALNDPDSRVQGIDAGADDFVSKPFDRAELRARVRNVVRLNRYRRLLAERTKFEWVVEHTDDGYLVVDDGDAVLYANPRARLYLGLPADDRAPIAETFLTLARRQYHFEPQEGWAIWPDPADRQAPRYLVRPASSTAGAFWLQVDLLPMAPGAQEQTLVHLRDVSASMVQRNFVWAFETQANHKLRSPLNLLIGFLDVLNDDLSRYSDEQRASILSVALDNALQLRDQILGVLQYLDLHGATDGSTDRCPLGEVAPIVAEIKTSLELPAIDVGYKGIPDPGRAWLPLSRRVVELILLELLENAKKFHPRHAPAVEVRLAGVADGVRLQVSDDGLTLSPAQLAKLWAPYYQAEKDFTGQVPGMGLGLSMVASLVWGVGGTCRAYNRLNAPGIVVEIDLPVLQED